MVTVDPKARVFVSNRRPTNRARAIGETVIRGRYATLCVVLTPGAEISTAVVFLTALMERVHSDAASPPGRKCFLLMDLSIHDLFRIIPDPGGEKRMTLSPDSISTVPFQLRASDVKIPEWEQHCSNCGMPCLVSIFGTFRRTEDQPNKNPGMLCRCMVDNISNITDGEIQWPAMVVMRESGYVGLVGCTNNCHNRRSSRKLILGVPQPIACIYRAVYSATFRVCKVHQFTIEVYLKWEMCHEELYTFENIPVL
jgi:hypothetical protein